MAKTCSVHRGPIRGKVHFWNKRPMCGRCYGYFTTRVHLQRVPRSPQTLGWLRRWLLGRS
jgi:hypothetical protein